MFENNSCHPDTFKDRLGKEWQIEALSHKPFPSGRLTHGVVHALMQLQKEHDLKARNIESIVCTVPPLVHRLVGRPIIDNMEANYAKLCLRFVAGVYLEHGWVDIPHFLGDELNNPAVLAIADKVDVIEDANPDLNALNPQHIAVELDSGKKLELTLDSVYGDPLSPLTDDENIEKFSRCCSKSKIPLTEKKQQDIIQMVNTLEQQSDVTALIATMAL